jgi:hypothetical protein
MDKGNKATRFGCEFLFEVPGYFKSINFYFLADKKYKALLQALH